MIRLWCGLAVAVAALLASGCSDNTPGELTAAAERVLAPEVQHVRDVAATGTYAQLQSAVSRLKAGVAGELRKGQVSASRATAIDDAADELLVDAQPTATPTSAPPTSAPPTSAPPTSATPTPTPTSASPTPTPTPSSASSSPAPGVTVSIGR